MNLPRSFAARYLKRTVPSAEFKVQFFPPDLIACVVFFFSDLKKRIAVEGDAITRAKEFLRRQRRSVQRRQVSVILD